MAAVIVREGDIFGRMTVLRPRAELKSAAYYHLCKCECGTEKLILSSNLTLGKTKSCGCLAREVTGRRAATHGMSKTAEYATWGRMWSRCTNPTVDRYPRYGGRGISVCDEWKSFEKFYADMGKRPSRSHSIGRKDNDAGYCKENCRWESAAQQQANTSRNVAITHEGRTMNASQWAVELGISASTIHQRLRAGMGAERALEVGNLTSKPITVAGETKLTTEWMKIASIPISSFYKLRREGMRDEEIVSRYLNKISDLQRAAK